MMEKDSRQRIRVFDGHNDTLCKMYKSGYLRSSLSEKSPGCQIDLLRAKKAFLTGGIFSIFTPPHHTSPEGQPEYALDQIRQRGEISYSPISRQAGKNYTSKLLLFAQLMEMKFEEKLSIVRSYSDLENCLEENRLSMVLHLEGAEAIDKNLANLNEYYICGLRSIAPVWSRPNDFGSGVPFKYPHSPDTGPGLTGYGKNLIKVCNDMGIIVDLAHMNLRGFLDAASISNKPLVVSHSNVYKLCQSTRNLTDEQIKLIGASRGLIGINFTAENINSNGQPDIATPLSAITEHIDYVAQRIGVDFVAIGSDFDGADMPDCLKDVTRLPDLIQSLKNRGYQREDLEKIAYRNWFRIFKETWKNRG